MNHGTKWQDLHTGKEATFGGKASNQSPMESARKIGTPWLLAEEFD
jgi:hypothetical protein